MSVSTSSNLTAIHILGRIGAGVIGGYAVVWGFIALSLAGLYAVGVPFHDAEAFGNILGFLLYLVVFLWAFAAQSLGKVWLILVGSGGLMSAAAALIQHSLV